MASSFSVGEQVSSYRLMKYLGADSFGEVWTAQRVAGSTTQNVTLKLPFTANIDQIREKAKIWKRASGHPNVLPVLEADEDNLGQVYIASEFADGGTLADWLAANEGRAPSLKSALRVMTDILEGLEYLHSLKPNPIIHGDLKPDNILLQSGIRRITDYGLARLLRATNTTKMAPETPTYMAPEVLSRGDYGVASDLWAAGVIFYQLLTGSLPFPQSELPALVHAILMGSAATLPDSVSATDLSTLRPIFTKIFDKEPENRYSSAESMRRDIEALIEPLLDPAPLAPQEIPSPPTTAVTTRRTLLVSIPLIGAAAFGLYALTHPGRPAKKKRILVPPTIKKINPIDGAEMAWIPAGSFQMGGFGERDGKPVHTVPLSGYWIYTTPVTVAQFRKYDNANGKKYDWKRFKPEWGWVDNHPMVIVTWDDASAYAKWAGGSLPTEAQWEKAARGGQEGEEYPWGDGWDAKKCASTDDAKNLFSTKPVKSYPANGYGLYDMAGNVWEWCSDWYDEDYYKTPEASQKDPIGPPNGISQVLRGGAWLVHDEFFFRCAFRLNYLPDEWLYGVGFRCVTLSGGAPPNLNPGKPLK